MMVAIPSNLLSFLGKFKLFYTTYRGFRQPSALTKPNPHGESAVMKAGPADTTQVGMKFFLKNN